MSVPTRAILMYKAPELGRVKTRLAKTIGDLAALELYRWMGRRQLLEIPSSWEVEIRFSPDNQISLMRDWLGSRLLLVPQGGGNLGDRMSRAARSCFSNGSSRKVIFLGADCLALGESCLKRAEAVLDDSDFVLGPATDGGYYLIGMRNLESSLFEEIDWGTSSVLMKTMDRIQLLRKNCELLERLVDVDDWDGLVDQHRFVDPDLWERLALPEE